MESLIETLNDFNDYLGPEGLNTNFATCFQRYQDNRNQFNRDFYILTLDKHPELLLSIEKILNSLNIPKRQCTRYLNQPISIYDLFVELNERDDILRPELAQFIQFADEQKNTRWMVIAIGSLLVSACGLAPFFIFELTVFQQVLTMASLISGGGLVYAVAVAIHTLNGYSYDTRVSLYQLFKDNFFTLSNNLLSIIAWALMLTAAASTPVVSVLFVAADFFNILKEAVSLTYLYFDHKPGISPNASCEEQQKQARELTQFERRRHELWVNFTAAILLTTIIAAWCFVPGGLLLSVIATLSMGVVFLTKQYALTENNKRLKTVLNNRFEQIERTRDHTTIVITENNPSLGSQALIQAGLVSEAQQVARVDTSLKRQCKSSSVAAHPRYSGLEAGIFGKLSRIGETDLNKESVNKIKFKEL